MSFGDTGAERAQPIRDARELQIRAADGVAEIQQDLGDTGHAGAADADEMDVAYAAHTRRHARTSASSRQASAIRSATACFACTWAASPMAASPCKSSRRAASAS